MTLIDQINSDLKVAMLAGEKTKTEILRGIKSAFLYEAVSLGSKDKLLPEQDAQRVLVREAKKRAEAAQLYQKAGETARADAELTEKAIIDGYLPQQMSEEELKNLVAKHVTALNATSQADMGKVIGAVRQETGAAADGSEIARLVREAIAE